MKEVERIISFVRALMATLLSSSNETYDIIHKVNDRFNDEFGFTLIDALALNNESFESEFEDYDSLILNELIRFFLPLLDIDSALINEEDVKQKIVCLINILDKKDKTFSFERMSIKNKLM